MTRRGRRRFTRFVRDYLAYGGAWKRALQVQADVDTPSRAWNSRPWQPYAAESKATLASTRNSGKRYRPTGEIMGATTRRREHGAGSSCRSANPGKRSAPRIGSSANLFQSVGIAYDQPPSPPKKPSEEYLAGLSLEDLFSLIDESNWIAFRVGRAREGLGIWWISEWNIQYKKYSTKNNLKILINYTGIMLINTKIVVKRGE